MDSAVIMIVLVPILIWFTVWLFILVPMDMAAARNRDRAGWVLVSLVGSPLLAIVALLILGKAR